MAGNDAARRAADETEIRNIIARLAMLADHGDLAEYVSLFTEDATWQVVSPPEEKVVFRPARGHADIVAAAQERRNDGTQGPGTKAYHIPLTTVVNLAGDTAFVKSNMIYVRDADKSPTVRFLRLYRDTFKRTADGWKLAVRYIDPA